MGYRYGGHVVSRSVVERVGEVAALVFVKRRHMVYELKSDVLDVMHKRVSEFRQGAKKEAVSIPDEAEGKRQLDLPNVNAAHLKMRKSIG